MKPVRRMSVNKGKSARQFRNNVGRAKAANFSINPMRGGWRL